ncbi:MAG: transglycosylase domain-containing protein, partial [Cyanobacteria bacterium]|nr:transglycosylase domain-containing protein [Cyanobacteriota bacterium]
MTSPTPTPPKTLLGQMTQVVKRVQSRIDFSKLRLRPDAKVAKLLVREPNSPEAKSYPLVGDRYVFGRSSKCDIQINSSIVSQVHGSLTCDRHQQSRFVIRDENSTNGIYQGKRRIRKATLYHNDVLTLGPPDLADAVQLQYYNPPPPHVRALRVSLYSLTGLFAVVALYLALEWISTPVDLKRVPAPGPVVVYARDGQPLNTVRADTHRDLPRLSDFSRYLPKAVVASEDSRYYWHLGIDPLGIARAAFFTLVGVQREGASTITQQVARSIFRDHVGTDDSIRRKIREAIVALKLEMVYGKDTILLTYLNRVYLGSGNYGFEDAARFYFDKPAQQLTLSEAATLVGMLPAPNNFNPIRDLKTAEGLRNRVINRMADLRMISSEEARQGLLTIIQVSPKAREALQQERSLAPYFYDYIYSELQSKSPYLAQQGNLIIETSLDLKMQAEADKALKQTIAEIGASTGIEQGAIVTLDAKTGEILAMVGGVDYQKSQFNRAAQALRQPGST